MLGVAVGGAATQSQLIGQQLDIAMRRLDSTGNILQQLTLIMDQSKALGQLNTVLLSETFFVLYRKQQALAFASYETSMDMQGLHDAMDQLVCFCEDFNMTLHCNPDGSYNPKCREGYAEAVQLMKGLILHQCHVIAMKLHMYHDFGNWNGMMVSGCRKGSSDNPRLKGFIWSKTSKVWIDGDMPHYEYDEMSYGNVEFIYEPRFYYKVESRDIRDPRGNHQVFWSQQAKGEWKNCQTEEVVHGECNPGFENPTWMTLSPHDWNTMIGSVLLLSHHSKYFVDHFGRQKIILDRLQLQLSPWFFENGTALELPCYFEQFNYSYQSFYKGPKSAIHESFHDALGGMYGDDQVFIPNCPNNYACTVQIQVPECLDDPKHWGHLTWKFCEFLGHHEKSCNDKK